MLVNSVAGVSLNYVTSLNMSCYILMMGKNNSNVGFVVRVADILFWRKKSICSHG
jgi:hypothetical protein